MKSGPSLCVFPSWTGNPYLNLMNLAPRAAGYQLIQRSAYESLLKTLVVLGDGDVLHVHWTAPIAQAAHSHRAAARRVRAVETALEDARRRGVRIVWTVHNRLPHELVHPAAERDLYGVLAGAADLIHVMAPSTAELVADVVALPPEKVVQIPHPSYLGVYDSDVSREEARQSFDLSPDDRAVLFLGQIRPYKGIDLLLEAAASARDSDGRRPVLLLAGSASPESIAQFDDLKPAGLRIVTSFESVPDADVARWYRAADIAVFPYRAILNSGSLHLAATMEVPAVLPGLPHLREQFGDQPWVSFFDVADPVRSLAELLSDGGLTQGVEASDFERFNEGISPWTVSLAYRDALRELSTTTTD
ncbi:glycosyltransferase family 4 protein [Microbacterium galbinum]|uniref:Glycosyltransferase family 4 protein n=1 Tax=Microbacterium galbinum TaxID=2851646 RepID=A0ABY4IT74_9MICO|nr:glycosyltransferase family 4 protein [Microbacterium galbinum]UPL15207.1 glycosyltransferase family 4 protein [Microbacterium galbinum]